MKPSSAAILRTLRRTPNEWVAAHILAQVGGLRFQERVHELNKDHIRGTVEIRRKGLSSEYRFVPGPAEFGSASCPCGWSGREVGLMAAHLCPKCGRDVTAREEQMVLL